MSLNKDVVASDKGISFLSIREVTLELRATILMLVVKRHKLCTEFARPQDRIVRVTLNLTCLLLLFSLDLAATRIFLMARCLCLSCLLLHVFVCNSNGFLYRKKVVILCRMRHPD